MKIFNGLLLFVLALGFVSCENGKTEKSNEMNDNVLMSEFKTPYGVPPFGQIKNTDYKPAFEEAIKRQKAEIEAIVNNSEAPDFENTIEALERSGMMLDRVSNVFFNLLSSNTNDTLQALAKEISPMVTAVSDETFMNDKLFQRVKKVYETADTASMTPEQKMLLKKTWKEFVRGGANLAADDKQKLKDINKELSVLALEFGDHVLAETNNFKLVIDNKDDLSGLPQSVIDAAASAAKDEGMEGKWVFTVQKPSMIPFLTYADNRQLREKIFKAYTTRCDHNDSLDNKEIVKKLVNLRLQKARLLGFDTWADFVLGETMAKTPGKVNALIDDILSRSIPKAKEEVVALQKLADEEKAGITIQPWDWWYYTEKLRKLKYDLSEEEMRPYFKLENVRDGMFDVANKLYGLTFKLNKDIPVMYPDALAYEVYDENNKLISILYMDFFPRPSKRVGAWMTAYRKQYRDENGKNVIPVISLTTNFTKPTDKEPSLLSWDEVTTLFHEFGHCLHGMLSKCTYRHLSGTDVPRDFVELPSQFMENFAAEPQVLKTYAIHWKTGDTIPDALIEKMKRASTFNMGFTVTEFVSAAALDMAWHTIKQPFEGDVNEFEKAALDKIGLIPQIVVRYRSTYYSHIFSGGYSAGYYSYLWTAVLDADAFGAFQETSIFDKKTAQSFRDNILSKGGTEDAEILWLRFRGREPVVDFYLKRQGLE